MSGLREILLTNAIAGDWPKCARYNLEERLGAVPSHFHIPYSVFQIFCLGEDWRALSGLDLVLAMLSQGVALGWVGWPLWGFTMPYARRVARGAEADAVVGGVERAKGRKDRRR
jgi:hypothetical protein